MRFFFIDKKEKVAVCSESNGEAMTCQGCMQSSDWDKVPAHLMSGVYTFDIDLIFLRRSITVQTTWIQRCR